MKLIDADALKRRAITVRFFGKDIMMVPTAEIKEAPTIDAVEVIRCKDCRYRKKVGTSYYCELDEFNVKDADFCSWGERREESEVEE